MKFALVDDIRREAEPKLAGKCIGCGEPMLAKCGKVKVRHWAHRGRRICDRWWENETEWHRAWKNKFPDAWQEVRHLADDGELHVADVKTDQGWVLEFQHSYLQPEERKAREDFYPKLCWVLDGRRRSRDWKKFHQAWTSGHGKLTKRPISIRRVYDIECSLLAEWNGSKSPVFFDFGDSDLLWCLHPNIKEGVVYLQSLTRSDFVGMHHRAPTEHGLSYSDFAKDSVNAEANYQAQL